MSTTEQRLAANRANALSSTGPITTDGKASPAGTPCGTACCSARLFLDDEDPAEFEALLPS